MRTDLMPGTLYRITWPDDTNQHRRMEGFCGEFLRWETRRCQLHGEVLGREALFQKVKPSGKRGSLFAVDPTRAQIITA
jgi:hypothetical protein